MSKARQLRPGVTSRSVRQTTPTRRGRKSYLAGSVASSSRTAACQGGGFRVKGL